MAECWIDGWSGVEADGLSTTAVGERAAENTKTAHRNKAGVALLEETTESYVWKGWHTELPGLSQIYYKSLYFI